MRLTTWASQAAFAVVPADQLTAKPPAVSWNVAGAMFTAGATAYAAILAVGLAAGQGGAIAARRLELAQRGASG